MNRLDAVGRLDQLIDAMRLLPADAHRVLGLFDGLQRVGKSDRLAAVIHAVERSTAAWESGRNPTQPTARLRLLATSAASARRVGAAWTTKGGAL